jgi:MFS family permease
LHATVSTPGTAAHHHDRGPHLLRRCYVSALAPNDWALGAARLVLGFAVGGSTQIVPTYIAELAPPERRGSLVTFFNVSIGVGILLAAIVGVAGHELFTWRWMFGVAVVPSAFLLLAMVWMPRSPRWLIEKNHPKRAAQELDKVRETPQEVRAEVADIKDVLEEMNAQPVTGWPAMKEPWVRPALVAGRGTGANLDAYQA